MMHSTNRAIAAAALLSVLAALPAAAALLPAGKPAGVKEANMAGPGLLWIGVAGILAVTIAVVVGTVPVAVSARSIPPGSCLPVPAGRAGRPA